MKVSNFNTLIRLEAENLWDAYRLGRMSKEGDCKIYYEHKGYTKGNDKKLFIEIDHKVLIERLENPT